MAATELTRTLVFPPGDYRGEVLVRVGDSPWQSLGPARGSVEFLDNAVLRLDLKPVIPGSHLPPEDFDASEMSCLSLAGCPVTDEELSGLTRFTNLETLSLAGTPISDFALDTIASLTSLRSLDLSRTAVSSACLDSLLALPRLRSLFLNSTPIDDEAAVILGRMTSLRTLHLSHTAMGDLGLQRLSGLTELRDVSLPPDTTDHALPVLQSWKLLEALVATSTQLSSRSAQAVSQLAQLAFLAAPEGYADEALEHLAGLSALRTLWLESEAVSDVGLGRLAALTRLQDLYLKCPFPRREAEVLATFPALRRLALFCETLRMANISHLVKIASLREFQFGATNLDSSTFAQLRDFVQLERLHIFRSFLSPWDFQDLKECLPNCTISHSPRQLRLPERRLRGELRSRAFTKAGSQPWAPHLPVRDGFLFPVNAEISYRTDSAELCDLEDLLQVQALEVLEMVINDSYVTREIAGMIPYFTRVKTLDFTRCHVDTRFYNTVHLMKYLTRLVLDFANFGDSQAEALSRSTSIASLQVRATMITEAALDSFARMPALRNLNLDGTSIPGDAVEAFRRKRPDVTLG